MKDVKRLNIKILTTESFPVGLAATNRMMTYAKGLAEHHCNVSVHCMKPSERLPNVFNHNSEGISNGIPYSYAGNRTILASSFLRRRWDNIYAIFKLSMELLKEKKTKKTDAIIYYSSSTSRAFIIYLITRIKKIVFLKEESEFPYVYSRGMFPLQAWFFNHLHQRLFDGFLIMTNTLIKNLNHGKNARILHVPMTVDFERFLNLQKHPDAEPYIAYCGVLNDEKDGVHILIDSFSQLVKEYPQIRLYLIGNAETPEDMERYQKIVNDNQLNEKVYFTGRVDKNQVPQYLINAKILVLPRPESLQAQGGFPTKLGEYLATGNPVIVTTVGEIPDYLTDLESAFFAEPGNIKSLTEKFKEILQNYPAAQEIGKAGQEVALKNFNYKIQTKTIMQFIKSFDPCVA